MKKLISLILLFTSLTVFAQIVSNIPHYDKYPKTPRVSYEQEILDFYSVKSDFGEFSNFALFPILVDNVLWPTSEHYYQAHKYDDVELQEWVRAADTPYEAAKRGRDPKFAKRADWKEIKDSVMEVAVVAKFTQYETLKELLLLTNKSEIFEHTKNDCYWGDCLDRSGQNKLGKLLMRIRNNF